MYDAARDWASLVKQLVFRALRGEVHFDVDALRLQATMLNWTFASSWASLMRSSAAHRSNVEDDRSAMILGLSVEAREAASQGDNRRLFQIVKALSPKSRRAQHAVCKDGSSSVTAVETRKAWQRHFAVKLAGVEVALCDLVAVCRIRLCSSSGLRVPSSLLMTYLLCRTSLGCLQHCAPTEVMGRTRCHQSCTGCGHMFGRRCCIRSS